MEIEACTPQRSGLVADPRTHYSTQKGLFDFSQKLFTVSVKYYLSDAPTTEICTHSFTRKSTHVHFGPKQQTNCVFCRDDLYRVELDNMAGEEMFYSKVRTDAEELAR